MTKVKYLIVTVRGVKTISGAVNGEPFVADEDHPNWEKIVQAAKADDPNIRDLIEPVKTVEMKFARLSDRLTVRNRLVYWDGDRVDHALADQIVRFLEEDLDFRPLVAFYDKISQNPSSNSQKLLYNWLRTWRFAITSDGDIVGYKGYQGKKNGGFLSTSEGHAFVNDQEFGHSGKHVPIPCKVGDVVTMPRHEVVDNPHAACAAGLHVGTQSYSQKFGNVRIAVLINPRDVVSVPDREHEKMRVCRYYVLGPVDSEAVKSLLSDAPQWEEPAKKKPALERLRSGSSILEDEPTTKPKVVPQAAKDTLAERRGVMTPEEKREKKRQADRDRRAKKKTEAQPKAPGPGIKHEGGQGYDWTLAHNQDLIRAANTNEELQEAFPDLSISRLKRLKRAFSK